MLRLLPFYCQSLLPPTERLFTGLLLIFYCLLSKHVVLCLLTTIEINTSFQ